MILQFLALIGCTLIIVRGTIFAPVRRLWPALLECSQCTGTWVGMSAGAGALVVTGQGRIVDALVVGCATSFLALVADGLLLKLLGDPNE